MEMFNTGDTQLTENTCSAFLSALWCGSVGGTITGKTGGDHGHCGVRHKRLLLQKLAVGSIQARSWKRRKNCGGKDTSNRETFKLDCETKALQEYGDSRGLQPHSGLPETHVSRAAALLLRRATSEP